MVAENNPPSFDEKATVAPVIGLPLTLTYAVICVAFELVMLCALLVKVIERGEKSMRYVVTVP